MQRLLIALILLVVLAIAQQYLTLRAGAAPEEAQAGLAVILDR